MEETILPPSLRKDLEITLDQLDKPINFEKLYGNPNPVELEIGIGKGLFLRKAAQSNPSHNYLGIDYSRKFLRMAKERLEKRGLNHVRLYNGEAEGFLQDYVADGSLCAVHLYFPDPWPKKRHHKRRIFTLDFIAAVHRMLHPGGILYVATDHADYWEWMQDVLVRQTLLDKIDRLPEPAGDADGLTNYEIKYIKEGRPIYKVCYRKAP